MAVESQQVAAFVVATLTADSQLASLLAGRIYRDMVPAAAALPAATVTVVSATDVSTLGALRAFEAVLLDVHVIGDGSSYGPINPIGDRIDAVLQNTVGARNAVQIVELRREQVQSFLEVESGRTYAHLVQTYRSESYAYTP